MSQELTTAIPEEFSEIASILQLDAQLLGDYSVKAINGRHLQESLGGSSRKHTTWAMKQVEKCGLAEGVDFELITVRISVPSKSSSKREMDSKEFIFTLNAAKEIAMAARDKGKLVRRYFLHMERVAQDAYRGSVPSLPDSATKDQVALHEFDFTVACMSRALEIGWGKGYVQKMIGQVAIDVDSRHKTQISRLIPAPTALPGQKEEVDIGKGEHMLRQVIGSKECNLDQFKDLFKLKSTTPLNETLVALGYQKMLKNPTKKGISGFQIVSGKEHYAVQIPISSGPFKGQFKISAWILNSFSEAEKVKILQHLKANYKTNAFV